jgi:hypothetical protein
MIKVMVVVWGLVMFVPQGVTGRGDTASATGLRVLFANGAVIDKEMEHQPTLWLVEQGGELSEGRPLSSDFALRISEGSLAGRIGLAARWRFAQLPDLNPGVAVKRTCFDNEPLCRTNGGVDRVLGTAVIEGEWTSRPASICDGEFPSPVVFDDAATFSYRKSENGDRRHDAPPFQLATVLVLEAEVSSLDDVLTLDGTPVTIPLLEGQACKNWIEGASLGTECGVIVLGNPPKHEMECDSDPCRFDTHFEAFYYMVDRLDLRYLYMPYVEENYKCPQFTARISTRATGGREASGLDPVTPPAVRCPPAFAVE